MGYRISSPSIEEILCYCLDPWTQYSIDFFSKAQVFSLLRSFVQCELDKKWDENNFWVYFSLIIVLNGRAKYTSMNRRIPPKNAEMWDVNEPRHLIWVIDWDYPPPRTILCHRDSVTELHEYASVAFPDEDENFIQRHVKNSMNLNIERFLDLRFIHMY